MRISSAHKRSGSDLGKVVSERGEGVGLKARLGSFALRRLRPYQDKATENQTRELKNELNKRDNRPSFKRFC